MVSGSVAGVLPDGTTLIAVEPEVGSKLLGTPDAFVEHQSRFDRQSRLSVSADALSVTEAIYLNFVSGQVQAWNETEIKTLQAGVALLSDHIRHLHLTLPDVVYLVKTSGKEEAKSAYTRHLNVVAIPVNMVDSAEFVDVLIHELFHLFSKNNPHRRSELYALVGYSQLGHEIELPAVPWPHPDSSAMMCDLRITNPDTPRLDTSIELDVPPNPGVLGAGQVVKKPLMPVLLAKAPYSGGEFFEYLQVWFLALEQSQGRWRLETDSHDRPVSYAYKPLMWQYLDTIGRNIKVGELFHPDEILAQNWVLVANQPSLGLLTDMAAIFGQRT